MYYDKSLQKIFPGLLKKKYHTMFPSFMAGRDFVLYGLPPFRAVELKRAFC